VAVSSPSSRPRRAAAAALANARVAVVVRAIVVARVTADVKKQRPIVAAATVVAATVVAATVVAATVVAATVVVTAKW
jgi:hypothetical protein